MNDLATRSPFEILLAYERGAQAHAAGSAEAAEAPGQWRGIGFRVGANHLLSAIGEINEILPLPPLTPIPGTKAWLLGMANVRGNLVAVVDLRGFIEGLRTPIGDRSRVLIARQPGGAVGLLVDEVLGQRSLGEDDPVLSEVPKDQDQRYGRFVTRHYDLGGKIWGVFSMGALCKAPEFIQAAA